MALARCVNLNERLTRQIISALTALTTAVNGLRYSRSCSGHADNNVTRSDLNAAEARLTAAIGDAVEGREALAKLVVRVKRISSRLKALSGKVTQLDSATDSTQTAP